MDHLGIDRFAVLGTSRGGLIAMTLGFMARDRLIGVCFNDIGPVIEPIGLDYIKDYVGKRPSVKTHAQLAAAKAALLTNFANVPESRWLEEAERQTIEKPDGLHLTYDPALRTSVLAADGQPLPDLWPFYDALDGMPLALIRGANSDLLSAETAAEMKRRIPDLIYTDVPDRGHIPFLDEPESVAVLNEWIAACQSR